MHKLDTMKQYKVTLNFTFEPHAVDDYDEDDYESGSENEEQEAPKKLSAKQLAYQRTEEYYRTHSVEEHVKQNDAFGFVEYVLCDGEVVSAAWDKKKFQIHMVVNTDQTKEELIHDLEMTSLEDGEYEACGDTGWIVMTRGPKGEVYDGGWDNLKDYWEYGLTDYRRNPIEVELIGDVPEVPEIQELVSLTEKGKEMHAKMKEVKEAGRYLSKEEEDIFKLLCKLMGDPKMYGTRVL